MAIKFHVTSTTQNYRTQDLSFLEFVMKRRESNVTIILKEYICRPNTCAIVLILESSGFIWVYRQNQLYFDRSHDEHAIYILLDRGRNSIIIIIIIIVIIIIDSN
jgi:hypothetical protein